MGKPAIVITQTPEEMPFDIRALRFIAYTDTGAGFEKLKSELKDAIIKIMNRQP